MSLRTPSLRLLRSSLTHPPQCLRPLAFPPLNPLFMLQRNLSSVPKPPRTPLDPVTLHRLEIQRRAYYKRRSYYAAAGVVFGMIAIYLTATSLDLEAYPPPGSSSSKPTKLDSSRRADDPMVVLGRERKVVIQKLGEEPEEIPDVVPTGTSTIPTFPRILEFFDDEKMGHPEGLRGRGEDALVEYQLVGVGLRTVSFLGIEVYVVGMYVATDDIAKLQQALISQIATGASSLVKGEKEELRRRLYDEHEGVRIWSELLKGTGCRTLVRIVPTRNTDFGHLRDAFVRVLQQRAVYDKEEYGDEVFGQGVASLKALLNRGSVPKGKELLLSRNEKGRLAVWYDDGKKGAQRLGHVDDERVSRAMWLNYLAGKHPASAPARKSIVDGVMEFVERPVGTVATQVQLQTHV
ncbi:putative altered inheritance of mitochondria protein 18, mitochondrial [Leptodontidium sp. MPI-SDFR-AT-0119]|nr:putative altered inheritance of mitochondria protein 18, mitochondrial [Leptodontidium sp. MPI-SDFR-AT-0119]